MGILRVSLLSGLALLVQLGCSSGSSGGSGGTNYSGQCASVCSTAAQSCGWSSADQNDCATGCTQELGSVPSACSSQANAAFSCAGQGSAWDCADGKPTACASQLDALEACQKNQSSNVSLQPFCNKCAQCLAQDPMFSEGFCDPFWNGSSFDVGSCTQNGNVSDIDTPSLTAGQISSMSCAAFDDAI